MRSCGLFSFPTALHCYIGTLWLILLFNSHSLLYANVWLFPFSTALHCYIGSLWLILLFFNSNSLLYRIIVAYFPLEQSLIVIQDNCGLFSFSTSIYCYMRTCALFSFSPAIYCYIGSFWLILLFFNSHSLLYRIIVAYFPLEQSLIVIWDHCGLFSIRTAIHCFMRSCGIFSFSTATHCYIG